MKFKFQCILVLGAALAVIFFIQSLPAFALLDDTCTCISSQEAKEDCEFLCSLEGSECLFCYLLTPKGSCYYESCETMWQWWCANTNRYNYFQGISCPSQCGWRI
jgi:hypothetical protein